MRWMIAVIAFMVTLDIVAVFVLLAVAAAHLNLFAGGYPAI